MTKDTPEDNEILNRRSEVSTPPEREHRALFIAQ
jgi:hypothetical protein